MYIVQIEQESPMYDRWKAAFDNDPIDRKKHGVRRHSIVRAVDNPNHVIINLAVESLGEAETLVGSLKELWKTLPPDLVIAPSARIYDETERSG